MKTLIQLIREIQSGWTDDQRTEFWLSIQADYCQDCGRDLQDEKTCDCGGEQENTQQKT